MEPWSSFATILGLISAYKAEGRARKDDEYNDLVQWLSDKKHKAIIEELNSNHILSLHIKQLLNRNHDEVIKSLSNLDNLLMQLACGFEDFKDIVQAISPNIELSDQAIDVLSQLERSGSSKFLEVNDYDGSSYLFLDSSGSLTIKEPRFIHDDLTQLSKLGLLEPGYNSQGSRIFKITRLTISYLNSVKK